MIEDSIYRFYEPDFIVPSNAGLDTQWFLFDKRRLLVKFSNDKVSIPTAEDIKVLGLQTEPSLYLGTLDNHLCFTGYLDSHIELPDQFRFEELRSLFGQIDDYSYLLSGRAVHILDWYQNHRYCGKCGTLNDDKADERAKICPSCGTIVYPTICPAIIVAVEKGDSILLAHAAHFANNMYSVIAGFVEPGETLEDCVKREIKEEVGLEVKNIQYFGSQPWPYPNSLMIGFTAEYVSGNITIDQKEIDDAGWFTVHNLPQLPKSISISRSLIDEFIKKNQK